MTLIDPDKNYFNELGSYTKCKYYLEAGYNKKLQGLNLSKDNCSFIHLNIRSMMKNMSQFENYLQNIHHKFTFIGLSETWINEGTADLFSINGYLCEHKFYNLVKTTDWIFVSLESSSQASFSLFHKKILEYFNACFPIKHVRSHYKNRKCWLSDTLKRFIIKKNKAYLLFKKCPNVTNEVLYKQYRSKVNSEMRLAERKYYQNMLENNKFNLK